MCLFQILIRNRATELDARMNDGTTPLILAARLAVEGMVEELIHCHADINAVDDHGQENTFLSFTVCAKYFIFILNVWSCSKSNFNPNLLGNVETVEI